MLLDGHEQLLNVFLELIRLSSWIIIMTPHTHTRVGKEKLLT